MLPYEVECYGARFMTMLRESIVSKIFVSFTISAAAENKKKENQRLAHRLGLASLGVSLTGIVVGIVLAIGISVGITLRKSICFDENYNNYVNKDC